MAFRILIHFRNALKLSIGLSGQVLTLIVYSKALIINDAFTDSGIGCFTCCSGKSVVGMAKNIGRDGSSRPAMRKPATLRVAKKHGLFRSQLNGFLGMVRESYG